MKTEKRWTKVGRKERMNEKKCAGSMKGDRKRLGNEKNEGRMKSEEENVEVSKRYTVEGRMRESKK